MFRESKAFNGYSIDDASAAKEFYGTLLGVEVAEEPFGISLKLATGGQVFLYVKDNHEPASFTVLNFPVDEIEAAVDSLAEKGVSFERYDSFSQDERGIANPPADGGPRIAWFKDPAGNILSVLSG